MSELDAQIPSAFGMCLKNLCMDSLVFSCCVMLLTCCCSLVADPFAEANADDSGAGSKEYVHVRIQQRNGRKSLTTVQGLKKEFSYSKILKDLKREFCCNGTVVQDPELGQVFFFYMLLRIIIICVHVNVPDSDAKTYFCRSSNFKVISGRMSQTSLSRYHTHYPSVTDEQLLLLLTFITGKPCFSCCPGGDCEEGIH